MNSTVSSILCFSLHPSSMSTPLFNSQAYSMEFWEGRMPGHLIPYPIRVEDDGSIAELPEAPMFPDTSAPVAGSKSTMLPMKLTT